MEKCKYCKKEFKKEEIDIHEFSCVSTFGNDNILENLIPCEICNQLIEFDKYNEHISTCGVPRLPSFYFNNISNISNISDDTNQNNISTNPNDIQIIDNFLNQLANTINSQNVNSSETNISTGSPPEENTNLEDISNPEDNNNPEDISNPDTENNDNGVIGINENVNIYLNSNIEIIRNNIDTINNILNTRINNIQDNNNYEELSELDNDNVKRGLNINKISNEIYLDNNIKCAICLDDFEKYQKMRQLSCEHYLCIDCCKEWFSENVKCPVCMKELG